jgi:hypothetical protein
MKFLLILFLFILELQATDYKIVFNHKIALDTIHNATLKLYEEDVKSLAENPARISIEYSLNGGKMEYGFSELLTHTNKYYLSKNSENFPIFYFKNTTFNTQKNQMVNLVGGVNIFDIDNNG